MKRNGFLILDLLSEHLGQYVVAMSNYTAVAKNTDLMIDAIGPSPKMAYL